MVYYPAVDYAVYYLGNGDKEVESSSTTPESIDLQKHFRTMIDNGCDYCAMEVSSHSLVLNRVDETEFKLGIFTNLTPEHLDFHKDLEDGKVANIDSIRKLWDFLNDEEDIWETK